MESLIIGCLTFVLGNFVYQAFMVVPDYSIAFERAWFQFVIVAYVLVLVKIKFEPKAQN